MKYVISALIALTPTSWQAEALPNKLSANQVVSQSLFQQILKNNPKIDKEFALKLSVIIQAKGKKYNIPPKLLSAILMQESTYMLEAIHVYCGFLLPDDEKESCVRTDFGIAQIHYKNLSRFKLDRNLLTADLDYSVDAGAKLLADYTRFQKKEPKTYYCRYNQGNKPFKDIKEDCLAYKSKVDRYL